MADQTGRAPLELLADRRPEFLAFVRRRVRSSADGDDLLQQAFARATERVRSLRDNAAAVPWFYRILRRLLAEHHASWAMRERRLILLAEDLAQAAPEEAAACACGLGLLDRLRPEYAEGADLVLTGNH